MMYPVDFRRVARAEFDGAADWYDQQRKGLGTAFISAVKRVLNRIADQPKFYPIAIDDVREAWVPGYPYCVYYRQVAGKVIVIAVCHTSRDPSVWQSRT